LHISSTIDQIYLAGVVQLTFEVGGMLTTVGKVNSKGAVAAEMPTLPPANEADVSLAGGQGRRLRLEFLV
jgi:hypothetical protein